jgi:hypothetical protein
MKITYGEGRRKKSASAPRSVVTSRPQRAVRRPSITVSPVIALRPSLTRRVAPVKTLATAAALALALAAAGCGGDDEGAGGPAEGPAYSVVLPDGWTDEGDPGIAVTAIEFGTGSEIEVSWTRENEIGGVRPNANVASQDVPAGTTPRQVADSALQALTDQHGGDPGFGGTRLGRVTPATLGGEKATQVEITSPVAGRETRQRLTIAVRGTTAYAVTTTAAAEGYDDVLPEFDEILASWQWND